MRSLSNAVWRLCLALFLCATTHGFTGSYHAVNRRLASPTSTRAFLFDQQDATTFRKGAYIPIAEDPEYGFAHEAWESRPKRDAGWTMVLLVPICTPIIAFLSYDLIATVFRSIIEGLSWARAWSPVDGGAYQAKIITPAINGVVLPAIAVLFATLTSTTVSTLRARQVEVRKCLNEEAGELRAMEYLLPAFTNKEIQVNCRQYLIQYCSRIIAESQPDWASSGIIDTTRGMDSELYGVLISLTKLAETDTPPLIVDNAMQSMTRLRIARQDRITALSSTYPTLHYWILGILAFGEATGFLMESDQELLGKICFMSFVPSLGCNLFSHSPTFCSVSECHSAKNIVECTYGDSQDFDKTALCSIQVPDVLCFFSADAGCDFCRMFYCVL